MVSPAPESPLTDPRKGRTRGYLLGLGLAVALTALSFAIIGSNTLWRPGVPAALLGLAIAQLAAHLAFLLRVRTRAEHATNLLALIFGLAIAASLFAGSLWVIEHLSEIMQTQVPIGGRLCRT